MPQQHFVQTHVIHLSLLSAIAILGSAGVHMAPLATFSAFAAVGCFFTWLSALAANISMGQESASNTTTYTKPTWPHLVPLRLSAAIPTFTMSRIPARFTMSRIPSRCHMVSNDCQCGPMSNYMRSQVAPRPEEFSVIRHLVGGASFPIVRRCT